MRELIAGSDQAEARIATFHGGIGDERREAIKRSFNSPPDDDPLRILIATDAAREGVNLQNHCKRLVHFDVPWNPGRMEQRNGRIDRTLQRAPQVYCHYFVLPQRPEDTVLDTVVRKTDQIRSELGCLPPVVIRKLNDLLAKGINPTALAATMAEIEGLDQEEAFRRTRALLDEELEGSRERKEELENQVGTLERAPGALAQVAATSAAPSSAMPSTPACSSPVSANGNHGPGAAARGIQPGRRRIPIGPSGSSPALSELPGGEAAWGDVLDALRPPRQPGQKLWQWRQETQLQPVVFRDPQEVNADRVHLHLEHPLVMRLLNRFLMRGFQSDALSRAAVLGTSDDTAKLIVLARLSLYGHGAARLHDEVLAVVAEWDPADPNRRLRKLSEEKSERAMEELEASLQQRLEAPEAAARSLQQHLAADVAQLREALDRVVEERRQDAAQKLAKRAEEEAARFVRVLEEQRKRIPAPAAAPRTTSISCCWIWARSRRRAEGAPPGGGQPQVLGAAAGRPSTLTWSASRSASAAPSRCRPTGWSRRVRSTSGRRGQCPRRCADAYRCAIPPHPRASHEHWLGLVQPVGLVVAPAVLTKLELFPNQSTAYLSSRSTPAGGPAGGGGGPERRARCRWCPASSCWPRNCSTGARPIWCEAAELHGPSVPEVVLGEYGETLRPTHGVPKLEGEGLQALVLDLTQWASRGSLPVGPRLRCPLEPHRPRLGCHAAAALRAAAEGNASTRSACCSTASQLRLVHAPRGESSGWLTMPLEPMAEVAGRPMLGALELLLGVDRLFGGNPEQRLPAAAGRQPQEPERGEHPPGRAGAGSPVGTAAGLRCGRAHRPRWRPHGAGRAAHHRRGPEAPLRRPDHGAAAAGVPALRGRRSADAAQIRSTGSTTASAPWPIACARSALSTRAAWPTGAAPGRRC